MFSVLTVKGDIFNEINKKDLWSIKETNRKPRGIFVHFDKNI